MQLEFLKKFFRCFSKRKLINKLSDLISKLYSNCFLNTFFDIKKIKLLYEKNKLHNFNQFLLKYPNIFKNLFFIHPLRVKLNYLKNEEIDTKDGFYLIFFIALVTKLIIILNTIYKDITVEDFIELFL